MAQHKVKIKTLTAIGLLAGLLVSGNVLAAEKNILFILDASGSMAKKFGDQTKMQAAKNAFENLLADLPEGVDVGMEAYGHHGNKDCSVIEVMNPVGPLDAAAISANVQSLTPRHGATPMAAALEQGAGALKVSAGEKSIVLISDGRETCGGDPAAVARKLRGKSFDITTHVVGLGVNDEEKAQLASIAEAGGGKYYAANNAEELKTSLAEIRKKVVAKKTKVIFQDDFDGEFLSDKWEILNVDEESFIVEDGHALFLTQNMKSPSFKNIPNILKLKIPMPKGDWTVTARFVFTPKTMGETINLGITNQDSTKSLISSIVVNTWNYASSGINVAGYKYSKKTTGGEHGLISADSRDLNQRAASFSNRIKGVFLRLERKGRNYVSSAKLDLVNPDDKELPHDWVVASKIKSLRVPGDAFFIDFFSVHRGWSLPNNLQGEAQLDWFKITTTE